MASAYELMLVLRGRNYLSNDLRKASADVRGLSRANALSGLQNQRKQLDINAQRLAGTKKIAQEELKSITTGVRRTSLNKAIAAQQISQANALQAVRRSEESLEKTEAARLRNAAQLSKLNRLVAAGGGRGNTAVEAKQLRDAAAMQQQTLMSEAATKRRQLEISQQGYANTAIAAQKLTEQEAALAARDAYLTDKINTNTAAQELNTQKMVENELAQRKAASRLSQYGLIAEHVGRVLQTFGLISAAAVGAAAFAASKFSTSVTLAATQSTLPGNNTTAQVNANSAYLQKQVQQILAQGQAAAKPADLTGGLYTIFSGLSLKGNQKQQLNEGLGILKEFSKVFTANFGMVSFNEVTKAGIALINNFGLSASQLPGVLNRMQASVRFGAMTMDEMTSSLNQIIPAFKAAGYGVNQMFADIAFVSRVFPSLRIGTTGLARLTETFGKFHDEISKDIGTNIAPGGHLLPVATIVADIVKAHPALQKGGVDLQNYFKSVTGSQQFVNARRVFSAYVSQIALYRDVSGKVLKDNNELAKSFTDMSQTPQVRWAEFTNQLRALVLEIGTDALPVFQKFAGPIKEAVHWFDQLSPSTKKAVGEVAAFVSIGALLGGTLLIVLGGLTRLAGGIRLFFLGKSGIAALEEGFLGTGTALRAGLLGAIILAIPLMIRYHNQLGPVVNALGGLHNVLKAIGAILTVMTFRKMIGNLAGIQLAAEGASTELGLVARNLALINGFAAVATVTIIYHRQIKNFVNEVGDKVSKSVPGLGFDPTHLERKIPGVAFLQDKLAPLVNVLTFGTAGDLQRKKDAQDLADFKKAHPELAYPFKNPLNAVSLLTAGLKKIPSAVAPNKTGATIPAVAPPAPFTDANVLAAVKNIVKLDELAKRKPSIANYEKANAALAALQTKASKDQFAAAQQLISSMESIETKHNKKSVSDAKKAAAERVQALKDAAANVGSIYDSLLSQNESVMGQLFGGPYSQSPAVQNRVQYGGKLTGGDYLNDLKSQTNQFKTFYSQIGRLQKRGAPQELINQLIQAGPSALPAIKALATMGSKQWGEYIKTFNTGQKLLHKQTMIQLTDQLKDYRKYGNKIALQIISGMRDHRIGLAKELKALITNMFGVDTPLVTGASKTALSDAKKIAKAHATTKAADAYSGAKTNTKPITGTHTRGLQGVVEQHTHYHLTAPTSEHTSIKTQIRHADFARKTKIGMNP